MENYAAEWVHIDNLVPWELNPVTHPPSQIDELIESIRAYGWGRPVVARTGSMKLIAGHGAREAMGKLLSVESDFVLDGAPGPGFIPTRLVSISNEQAAGLAIIDNRSTRLGVMHDHSIASILEALDLEGLPLGYDEDELTAMSLGFDEITPEVFRDFDAEDIEAKHRCPSCGYEWR